MYNVELPDGTLVQVPDNVPEDEARRRIRKQFPQFAEPADKQSILRQVADVPLGIARGATQGARMISDIFGAGSKTSQNIAGVENYIADLMSAQSKKDQQEIARIQKEAEDKGIWDQVKAGARAFAIAPIDTLSSAAGTALPVIAAGLGAATLGAPAAVGTGIAALMGAGMGAGTIKGSIYEATKQALIEEGATPQVAEQKALQAQEYGGKNLDQILLGTVIGGVAGAGPLERGAARILSGRILNKAAKESGEAATKSTLRNRVESGLLEAAPEALQAGQEQVAQNIALQREGMNVPTFRGAVGAATLEGLAGAGLGAAVGRRATPPELMEGQMAGETARQSAERLQQEINDLQGLKAIQAQQDAEALQTGIGIATTAKMPQQGETPLRPPPRPSAMQSDDYSSLLAPNLPPAPEVVGPTGIASAVSTPERGVAAPSSISGRAAVDSMMVPTDRALPAPVPTGYAPAMGGIQSVLPQRADRPAADRLPDFNQVMAQEADPFVATVGIGGALGGIEPSLPSRPTVDGTPTFNQLMAQDKAIDRGIASAVQTAIRKNTASEAQGPATPILKQPEPTFVSGLDTIVKGGKGSPSQETAQGPATPIIPVVPPAAPEAGVQGIIKGGKGQAAGQQNTAPATPVMPQKPPESGVSGVIKAAAGQPSTVQGPLGQPLLPQIQEAGLASATKGGRGTPTKTTSPSNVNNLNVPEATDEAIQQEQAPEGTATDIGTAGGTSVPVVGGQGVESAPAGTRRPKRGAVGSDQPDAGGTAGGKAKQSPALKKSLAATETEPEPEIEDEAVDKQIALKTKQLQAIMLRIMSGMGLRDVGLKLVANMDAEGEYANQLITLALNVDSPVRVLRHESIHAMKAMGLFSPQQWETLRKEASTKWIKQFLGEGEGSRFEQYQKLFKDQGLSDADANEAMIEEAIADAFGEFDLRGAPSGLMSAILKRMQNMFAAIKSAFGGTETAEQILQRAEKGKLQGKQPSAPKEAEQPEEPEEPKASLRRAAVPDETEISTQNPQGVNRRYDPIEQMLSIDQKAVEEAMELNPKLYDSITDAILRYGFIPPDTKREDAISVFKKNIVNNLLFLHDAIPKDIANRSKLWYDGAHVIAKEMGKQYGMKMEQVAGIFAAMSPQKDWFQNVSMGERAIDILINQGDATWDDNMLKYAESYIREPKDRKEREKRQIFFDKNIRQTSENQTALKDMDIENAAAFIRAFDEAYNSRQYRIVTPEGGFAGLVNKKDGDPAIMTWSTYGPIEKAVSIFRDPSRKNISEQLGEEHKIRSFYNNIAAPNADIDHVTIDTHAVAAGLFEALAGSDTPVAENFGTTGGTNLLGVGGTYGIIADAYREAAKARGVQAREMQSITWEAIRGLFTEELKSGIKPKVRAEWEKYKAGEQSFNEARDAIVEIASKNRDEDWRDPDWIDSGPGQTVADGGASYDKDFVPEGGVRLREESVLREKLTFNLSSVTNSIPGLKDLYQKAMSGDQAAYSTLQKAAESSLRYLLSGTSARITVDYAKGVYLSDREPSIAAKVAFSEEDRPAVLAALERFASNYNQYAVHVRQGTAYPLGTEFDDGSYATAVFTIDLQKNLTNEEIGQVLTETNLEAFTVVPTKTPKGIVNQLVAYWCKLNSKPQEEQEDDFKQFKANLTKAAKLVGVAGKKPRKTIERLFVYADDDERSTHTYGRIRGDVSPKQGADTETPRIIADYIRGGAGTVVPPKKLNKFQVLSQKLLASVQEALPVNDLKKPLVRKAYNAANVELAKQFAALPVKVEVVDLTDKPGTFYYDGTYKSGTAAKGEIVAKDEAEAREQLKQQAIDVDKIRQRPEPYANSAEMRKDVSNNNVLKILKTQAGSFGPEGVPMSDHPLLEMSEFKDINKVPLLYNDMLRAVHDYYAHGVTPAEFGPVGEATAWLNHMATTMSPLARWVITAETRLQNAWQNFRPGAENIPLADRPYALQKAALPPVQFALTGKADIDAPMLEFINTLTPKQQLGSLSEKSPLVKKIGPATTAKFSIRAPNTKEFKQWFEDSKVVDENGDPLVVYHGTMADITSFKPSKEGVLGAGVYLTPDPKFAENYSTENGNILPVFASLKNPLIIRLEGRHQPAFVGLMQLGMSEAAAEKAVDHGFEEYGNMRQELRSRALKQGYDGIMLYQEGSLRELVVFDPTDIKSAIGNQGTYNRFSPDIRKSIRAPQTEEFKQWFGNSKIVGKDGQPLVMYHGTARDINVFTPKQANAIFLTGDREFAEGFASMSLDWVATHYKEMLTPNQLVEARAFAERLGRQTYSRNPKLVEQITKDLRQGKDTEDATDLIATAVKQMLDKTKRVMEVYVRAEKPFDYENADHIKQVANLLPATIRAEVAFSDQPGITYTKLDAIEKLKTGEWDIVESKSVQKAIRELGFDAFYTQEGGEKNIAVYNSNQIKSATNNEGTYDINNPDIRKSLRSGASKFKQSEMNQFKEPGFKSKTKLIELPINEFLNLADNEFDQAKLDNARRVLQEGGQFNNLPMLGFETRSGAIAPRVIEHEGRHRARALLELGYTSMPVIFKGDIRWSEQETRGRFDYREEWPTKLQAQSEAIDPNYLAPFPVSRGESNQPYTGDVPPAKASLRSSLPAALVQRVEQTTVAREDKGFISRILKAISPGDHTSIRAELLNRYNQLSVIDKMRIKKMGGAAAMADISAESAALLSDLRAGIVASALGVHDKVGGAPVYVQSFYVVRNGQILPRRYKTKALAQAAAGTTGEVRSGGHTAVGNFNGSVKGPLAIFAPLAAVNDPMIYQLYQFWAAAKRGKRLTKEGREELLTPADQAHAQFLEKKYPMFVQVQKDFIKYNNKLVDYMVDTGVLSPERGKIYTEHADYLPFYRQIEGLPTAGPKIFASISGVKPPKALKGSDARLDDFLETIVRNTQAAVEAGVKNVAAQRSVEAAKDVGLAVKIPQGDGMPTTVVVHENGVPTYYACGDVLFVNAMKSLGMSDIPFLSLLSMPANLLRAAVTKEPTFMLANMLRDSLSSYVTSGVSMTPVIDTAKNFAMSMAGKSPEYDALRKAGIIGGYEFAQGVETSGRKLGEKLKAANVKSTGLKRVGEIAASPVTGIWQFLEKGSEASDAATRIEIYKRTLAETGNETEALFKSLEVMNFNRKGRAASVRVLTAVVPFLNARMQGLDILYRAAIQPSMPGQSPTDRQKELQHKFLVRGATMAALSCLYWALTSDDDEYKKQEQDTKDNYWLFPSMGIKIPIPFEIGVLFKVIPERIMALSFGDDSFKDFRQSMTNQVISTLHFNPIPQAVIPIVENITNHSFFTGRDIVSEGVADLEAGYQTSASTSSLMADFGRATGLSPIKLEAAIQGYTGQMGMYLVSALDAIYEANSTIERPAKRFEQLPLIKRFAIDPEARGSVTAFFELKDKVDAAVKTINVLERGDPEIYDKYIETNENLLASKEYINVLASDLKDLAKMKVMIRASDDSAEVKKDALLEIQQLENELTANIKDLRKEFNP